MSIIEIQPPSSVALTLRVSIVIQIVAKHYNRTTAELISLERSEPLVTQRQLAMLLARKLTRASFPFLAQCFAKKHHGTIIHAVMVMEKRQKTDVALLADCALLTKKIQLAFTPTAKFQPEKV